MGATADHTGLSRFRSHSAAVRLGFALVCEAAVYATVCAAMMRSFDVSLYAAVALWLALYLTTRLSLVGATFAFAWWLQRPWHLSTADWIRMAGEELAALLRVEWLILLEPWRRRPIASRQSNASSPLVIFVHGIYCNRGIWRPVMRHLRHMDCEMHALSIEPVTADLATQTRAFAAWLDSNISAYPPRRVIVVAHSLGGLVARNCVSRIPIDTLICIGTPHAGSRVANMLRSAIGKDLRPHSTALNALTGQPIRAQAITCIHSPHDNLVVPAVSAVLADVPSIALGGTGHLAMIYSPLVLEAIAQVVAPPACERNAHRGACACDST